MELLNENNQANEKEKQKPVQKGNHGLSATRFMSEKDSQSRAVDLTKRMMGGRRKGTHTPPVPTSMKEA